MAGNTNGLERSVSKKEISELNLKERKIDGDTNRSAREGKWNSLLSLLERKGDVELRGATPVPLDVRTEIKYANIFTLWFCVSCNPLP